MFNIYKFNAALIGYFPVVIDIILRVWAVIVTAYMCARERDSSSVL